MTNELLKYTQELGPVVAVTLFKNGFASIGLGNDVDYSVHGGEAYYDCAECGVASVRYLAGTLFIIAKQLTFRKE